MRWIAQLAIVLTWLTGVSVAAQPLIELAKLTETDVGEWMDGEHGRLLLSSTPDGGFALFDRDSSVVSFYEQNGKKAGETLPLADAEIVSDQAEKKDKMQFGFAESWHRSASAFAVNEREIGVLVLFEV